jgi:hypothetical protein
MKNKSGKKARKVGTPESHTAPVDFAQKNADNDETGTNGVTNSSENRCSKDERFVPGNDTTTDINPGAFAI